MALSTLCEKRGLVLIEDCAQAHGCRYEGAVVGMKGDYGCFSLNEFKHISCGDGGIVVSKRPENASRLRLATDKAYNRAAGVAERNPIFLANNYRMTELQGAVALAQFRKLEDIVARRRRWCAGLSERLRGTPGITLPEITPGCDPSWWFYLFRAVPDELHVTTDEFVDALKKEKLSVGAHYIGKPVYEFPIFLNHSAYARGLHPYMSREYAHGLCPNAEAILDTCIMIGINEGFTETDLEETARGIARTARWFSERRAS
jgi:dTDP-4-amino-4,6-dideoxygalactose transaminase